MTTKPKSDERGTFFDWDLKTQIAHIRKCQKNGLECIQNGEDAQLADISDHLDIWGPWLCDRVEELDTKLSRTVNAAYHALLEMSAWLGIPEKKRKKQIDTLIENVLHCANHDLRHLDRESK